jgi:hypothetical protein
MGCSPKRMKPFIIPKTHELELSRITVMAASVLPDDTPEVSNQ